MEHIYVFFTRECKPESLTGYAATKGSVLTQVSTLRSALQVQYQLGVTSKMKHDIYSKLGDFELVYLGGFDDQEQAFVTIQRLHAEKNPKAKVDAPKWRPAPEGVSSISELTPPAAVKEEVPTEDLTVDEIVESLNNDIKDSGLDFSPILED